MKQIRYILSFLCISLLAFPCLAQIKVLKLKKNGGDVYAAPLNKVGSIYIEDTWNSLGKNGKSLLREIASRPELSKFTQAIRSAGYDFALDLPSYQNASGRILYHVVAPTNTALKDLSEKELQDSTEMRWLVRRYISVASTAAGEPFFSLNNNSVTNSFGTAIPCSNGTLYISSKEIQEMEYMLNVLAEQPELEWIYTPLSQHDAVDQGSEVGLQNDVYPGSIGFYSSSTTSFVPTPSAYEAFKKSYGDLFQMPKSFLKEGDYTNLWSSNVPAAWLEGPASLTFNATGRYTSLANCPDLLYSAGGKSIRKSDLKISGNPLIADDGVIYMIDEVPPISIDEYYKPILIEGEDSHRLYGVTSPSMIVTTPQLDTDTLSYSPLSTDYDAGRKHKVSGGSYIYVKNASAQVAGVTFGIANTMSGDYDVWVTFIPSSVVPGVDVKQNLVKGTLSYTQMKNESITQMTISIPEFGVDAYRVTRVKVAEIKNLSPCYMGFLGADDNVYRYVSEYTPKVDLFKEKYGVKLQLSCAAGIRDAAYDHSLYIDCIELIPCK